MTIREEQRDLLSLPQGWAIAHCISADFALGAGVAKQIDDAFNMRDMLVHFFGPDGLMPNWSYPCCLPMLNVFNLVIKEHCFQKPTMEDLEKALYELKDMVKEHRIVKLAMPRIGCGLDKLNWDEVRTLVEETFYDTDVEILVCYL